VLNINSVDLSIIVKQQMATKKTKKRGRGRPYAGGASPIVGVRLSEAEMAEVDALAEQAGVKRSEMVRRLLEAGRKALGKRNSA
jgi:Ribbon-helix-helix protein, copG family